MSISILSTVPSKEGKRIPDFKVVMASSREEGCVRDYGNEDDDDKLKRLFIVVPKTYNDVELREEFEKYGAIRYVKILRDRESGNSKGLAYVKYGRAYDAAIALETCPDTFRPVWASNDRSAGAKRSSDTANDRYSNDRYSNDRSSNDRYSNGRYSTDRNSNGRYSTDRRSGDRYGGDGYSRFSEFECAPAQSSFGGASNNNSSGGDFLMSPAAQTGRSEDCCIEVLSACSQEQLQRLFDLIPGFEYCDLDRNTGVAYLKYVSPKCAMFARDRLHGFEYPTGCHLSVRYPPGALAKDKHGGGGLEVGGGAGAVTSLLPSGLADLNHSIQSLTQSGDIQGNIQQLVDSIQKATCMLSHAGVALPPAVTGAGAGAREAGVRSSAVSYCSLALPERQARVKADVACRLFLVAQPEGFAQRILDDLLCRFGGLIDAYFVTGRNIGYAKFASRESAQAAIDLLHGQTVAGMRLKVMEAEDAPARRDAPASLDVKPTDAAE